MQVDVIDVGSIPGSARSTGGGHGNTLQYFCMENPMERGAWPATVHRVTQTWTWLKQLSTHTQEFGKISEGPLVIHRLKRKWLSHLTHSHGWTLIMATLCKMQHIHHVSLRRVRFCTEQLPSPRVKILRESDGRAVAFSDPSQSHTITSVILCWPKKSQALPRGGNCISAFDIEWGRSL